MTNREKLAAMSDGELGKWICELMDADDCKDLCPARKLCYFGHNGMTKWLKSEAETKKVDADGEL